MVEERIELRLAAKFVAGLVGYRRLMGNGGRRAEYGNGQGGGR